MKMVKVKTADLIGAQLDWAVAKVLGLLGNDDDEEAEPGKLYWCGTACESSGRKPRHYVGPSQINPETGYHFGWFRPSTSWCDGGPLWQKHVCSLEHDGDNWVVVALFYSEHGDPETAEGKHPDSHLIAFCRAFIASKLGDEVEVPKVSAEEGATP